MPPNHQSDLINMLDSTFGGTGKRFYLAHKDGKTFSLKLVEGDQKNPSRDFCWALSRDEFDSLVSTVRAVWSEVKDK